MSQGRPSCGWQASSPWPMRCSQRVAAAPLAVSQSAMSRPSAAALSSPWRNINRKDRFSSLMRDSSQIRKNIQLAPGRQAHYATWIFFRSCPKVFPGD